MKFVKEIALLMILTAIQLPCTSYAAEEDKELALIAAEQERSGEDEQLDDINPALTDNISTEQRQETDKDIKARKKKLDQTRKEKEKDNERKLRESTTRNETRQSNAETIIIDPNEPTHIELAPPEPEPEPEPKPQPVTETPQPVIETPQPVTKTPPPVTKTQQPVTENELLPNYVPPTIENIAMPDQKEIYANFTEVSRAVKFIPLYMPRKSGYEITAIYAGPGIAEIRYGRRWEPSVSLTVRTHKRADGEEPQDISGVTGVKWRVDTTTGTTVYVAKISDTQQVAAWAVGHYTFSARGENLSYAGFYSLVADELVELSTHYYFDL